ncbi:MAG TPA: hypothetical protein PKA05_11340, partial [Roseiflexaceae bacterium]|nr:hypothetical protein [Roseiflexaceae bacterium]
HPTSFLGAGKVVELAQLDTDRSVWPQGVGGEDPRDATAAHGEQCIAACLELLGARLRELIAREGVRGE